jgi:hypothetical protein
MRRSRQIGPLGDPRVGSTDRSPVAMMRFSEKVAHRPDRDEDVYVGEQISAHNNTWRRSPTASTWSVTPQGRDPSGRGRLLPDPGFDAHRLVRRTRPRNEASYCSGSHGAGRGCRGRRPSGPSPSTTWRPGRGRGGPQGRRGDRRDPLCLQGSRVGDRGPDRPRRGRRPAHHAHVRVGSRSSYVDRRSSSVPTQGTSIVATCCSNHDAKWRRISCSPAMRKT